MRTMSIQLMLQRVIRRSQIVIIRNVMQFLLLILPSLLVISYILTALFSYCVLFSISSFLSPSNAVTSLSSPSYNLPQSCRCTRRASSGAFVSSTT